MLEPRYDRSRSRLPLLITAVLVLLVLVLAGGVLMATKSVLDTALTAARPSQSGTQGLPAGLFPSGPATGSPGSGPTPQPIVSGGTTPDISPTPEPEPSIGPTPAPSLDPPPAPGPFAMDLYRKGADVPELRDIWCVPAAMQTSINIMKQGPVDRSKATQARLYALARTFATARLVGPGAEPEGWAGGLNQLGYGPYEVAVEPTVTAAIQLGARQLRLTGRPVGLMVWRGAHSWVMSGFRATADPGYTDHYRVTAVFIEDVWYPRISSIWGVSRPPDALVPVGALPQDYLPWKRPTHPYPGKDGRFVLIVPTVAAPTTP